MKLHAEQGSLEPVNDSLGKPEIVIGDLHFPLVHSDYYRASKLRILRNSESLALLQLWNFSRVINRIYYSGDTVIFKRFNGETAYVLPIAGR